MTSSEIPEAGWIALIPCYGRTLFGVVVDVRRNGREVDVMQAGNVVSTWTKRSGGWFLKGYRMGKYNPATRLVDPAKAKALVPQDLHKEIEAKLASILEELA